MFKIVLDTNVVISVLLKANSLPDLIFSLALRKQLRMCLSEEILAEYQEVLGRKKFSRLDASTVKQLLGQAKKQALWVDPEVAVNATLRDPADNKFLDCALEAGADFLITGNIRHFPFKSFRGTRIVTPRQFIDQVLGALVAQKQW